MKILCVSDTIDPLVYSNNIKERYKDIDIVISAGDVPMNYLGFIASSLNCPLLFVFGNHNLARYEHFKYKNKYTHSYANLEFTDERNENRHYLQRTYGSTYIGSKSMRVKNIIFVGLGGSIRYNKGKNQYTDLQMYIKIILLMPRLLLNKILYGRYVDVLLAHSPPYNINDARDPCHIGFKAFRWFIRAFKPRYFLHGHIHLYDINAERTAEYGATQVINVYSHYLLEYSS